MVLIVIVGALAVAGVAAVALYAVQLARRVSDVRHEVEVTAGRILQIRAVADQLQLPPGMRD